MPVTVARLAVFEWAARSRLHNDESIEDNMYKLHSLSMTRVTLSQFRNRQSDYIAEAQRDPVEITSRGAGRRAVVVSPEFYDRAVQALEDQADVRAAEEARWETGLVSHDHLVQELEA